MEHLQQVPDIGQVVTTSILRFFAEAHNREVIATLRAEGVHWPKSEVMAAVTSPIAGKTNVLTCGGRRGRIKTRQGAGIGHYHTG